MPSPGTFKSYPDLSGVSHYLGVVGISNPFSTANWNRAVAGVQDRVNVIKPVICPVNPRQDQRPVAVAALAQQPTDTVITKTWVTSKRNSIASKLGEFN